MSEEQKKKKFNLYRLLNEGNDDKGVEKGEVRKLDFAYFFKLLGRRFGAIVKLNLLWLLANFPIFFLLFALSGYAGKTTTAPASALFANLHPLFSSGNGNPVLAALYGVTGIQGTMFVSTTLTYVMYGLSVLTLFTFGLATVGVTYNLRNLMRGEPLFLLSDFWDAVRKNLRQGIIYGIFDLAVLAALIFDIRYYGGAMRAVSMGILILYLLMRFYIYILIPTFDLSLFKILKNSLIFLVLNIKRNLAAFAGVVLVLFANFALLNIFYPLGMLMPLALTISLCMFIGVYAAWPCIKEIMIDPYEQEQTEKPEPPIFQDRG